MLQSFWMLVAAFFFAVMSAFVKLSSAETGTFEIVFWRSLISFTVIWGFMLAKGCSPRTNYLTGHLKRSILGTVSFTMWFATMGHLPLGTSTTLNYTAPLFIAVTVIVIALKNREKAPWLLALAIVTGFIGVCLVLQPSVNGEQFKWALLGLFAASMGPIIFFQIKQLGNLHEPSWRIVFYFSLVGTIWGLGGNLILEGGIGGHSPETWGALLGVGITAVLAQVCLTRAYAYGNMMLTACFQFATIPIAELIGTFCFGESLPATALTGMALILVAGCAASVITKQMEKNRKKKASSGL
ncbi:DMT family transporter [Duodenibacillus massiliensis]|uniref:DMT family transporter n=1 Tax=Duodenibacillus massiliensis TaxID=1852381 RepID=UPI003AB43319